MTDIRRMKERIELTEHLLRVAEARIDQAESHGAEKALRQAADDFEVTAALGGSVIEQLRARADEIAQGIR